MNGLDKILEEIARDAQAAAQQKRAEAQDAAARVIERSILRDMKEKTEKQPKIEYIGEEEAE